MTATFPRIRIGISACLLGEPVRFNAGHKQSSLCTDVLAKHFDFVSLCPEMAIGLGTPRPAIRLQGDPRAPRAVVSRSTEIDVTDALREYGEQAAQQYDDICGFILMQKSPSCGVYRVKVYQENGYSVPGGGRGIFADALIKARPDLPVEEDGRLHDPVLRENFITRVYAYARWQTPVREGLTRRALYSFHASYKYQLLASSRVQYQALGQLLAKPTDEPLATLAQRYFSRFMQALSLPASRGSHCNVLQHIAGYLKRHLSADDKRELQQAILDYRVGDVPLVVPLTLLKHHFRNHPDSYIAQQAYLQPHPAQLGLRNAL